MRRIVLAALLVMPWAGCSCRQELKPAPEATEAPQYAAPAAAAPAKPESGEPAKAARLTGTAALPVSERVSIYNLPLVIKIDLPEVPEEIRGPSKPIEETKETKKPEASGGSWWSWPSGAGGKK